MQENKRVMNENVIGKIYGELEVVEEITPLKNKKGFNIRMVKCRCSCGKIIETRLNYLRCGHKKSCGHIKSTKNGLGSTKLCKVWRQMHDRCENRKNNRYADYGGRGIKVCKEWSGNEGFFAFYEWAKTNGYKSGLTIDRINVNGNYEPSNCRWATYKEQNNNQRDNHILEYKGERHTISEWADITGIRQAKIGARINKLGFTVGQALEFEEHIKKYRDMKKVRQIDKNTKEEINNFNSIGEASRETNICRESISKCCSKKVKTAGGYLWEFVF